MPAYDDMDREFPSDHDEFITNSKPRLGKDPVLQVRKLARRSDKPAPLLQSNAPALLPRTDEPVQPRQSSVPAHLQPCMLVSPRSDDFVRLSCLKHDVLAPLAGVMPQRPDDAEFCDRASLSFFLCHQEVYWKTTRKRNRNCRLNAYKNILHWRCCQPVSAIHFICVEYLIQIRGGPTFVGRSRVAQKTITATN